MAHGHSKCQGIRMHCQRQNKEISYPHTTGGNITFNGAACASGAFPPPGNPFTFICNRNAHTQHPHFHMQIYRLYHIYLVLLYFVPSCFELSSFISRRYDTHFLIFKRMRLSDQNMFRVHSMKQDSHIPNQLDHIVFPFFLYFVQKSKPKDLLIVQYLNKNKNRR